MCEDLVPIPHMCEELVPILLMRVNENEKITVQQCIHFSQNKNFSWCGPYCRVAQGNRYMGQFMGFWYLSHMYTQKPPLNAHSDVSSETRRSFFSF